jgi:hypothetical protein
MLKISNPEQSATMAADDSGNKYGLDCPEDGRILKLAGKPIHLSKEIHGSSPEQDLHENR